MAKAALITGAAQGIGLAIAERLAMRGVEHCFLVDINEDLLRSATDDLKSRFGTEAIPLVADLSQESGIDQVVAAISAQTGSLDILVNSAGTTERASFADARYDQFDRIFALNAKAPFFLISRLGGLLDHRTSDDPNIVNIISMNAYAGVPELAVYSASKAALWNITKNAANALRDARIRVNGINVGWVDSPAEIEQQEATLGKGEGWMARTGAERPFGRHFHCEDVARIAELLSFDAGPVTGVVIDQEQWVVGMPN